MDQDQPPPPPVTSEARVRDRRVGLALVAGAFVASLGISIWAKRISGPELGQAPAPASSVGVPGWPSKIDVLGSLPRARELTPRTLLRGIVIEGSKSDGTIDVKEGGEVKFQFQSAAGQGPQPPRKPGVVPRKNNCGRQSVRIHGAGMGADLDQPGIACSVSNPEPLPEPRCSIAKVWSVALRKGAPPNGRARIEYYRSVAGPAWRFEVAGSMRLHLYGDCERELVRGEAASAPQ